MENVIQAAGMRQLLSSVQGVITEVAVTCPLKQAVFQSALIKDLLEKMPQLAKLKIVTTPHLATLIHKSVIPTLADKIEIHLKTVSNFSPWIQDQFLVTQGRGDLGHTLVISEGKVPSLSSPADIELARFLTQQNKTQQTLETSLLLEGGNVLAGDNFVLVGNHELLLFHEASPGCSFSESKQRFLHLFQQDIEKDRKVYFVGGPFGGNGDGMEESWRRSQVQALNHIDRYITLSGQRDGSGRPIIIVAEPVATASDEQHLNNVAEMKRRVQQNLLSLRENFNTEHRLQMPLVRIDGSDFWMTYNNCLVQVDETRKHVWMPTFSKHSPQCKTIEKRNQLMWMQLGFEVTQMMDCTSLAIRGGGLHCVVKCLKRI